MDNLSIAQPKCCLSEEDLRLLGADDYRVSPFFKGMEIHTSPRRLHLLLEGLAFKYRLLHDGRRQVLGLHMAGDVVDLDKLLSTGIDFKVQAATRCRVADFSMDWLKGAATGNEVARGLFWSLSILDNVAMCELITSLGSRTARERTAWFIFDLVERLEKLEKCKDNTFELELTQSDMADLLGLSLVHMNRSLKTLKAEGLISNHGSTYTILDRARLRHVAGYSPYKRDIDATDLAPGGLPSDERQRERLPVQSDEATTQESVLIATATEM